MTAWTQWGLIALAMAAAASLLWTSVRLDIGPMPSFGQSRQQMLTLIPQDTTGLIFELGAGWGGLAFALAKHCPAAQVVGVEWSLIPFGICRLRQAVQRTKNLTFVRQDFFQMSLTSAQLLVCYLCPQAMQRLAVKAERELPPGARIVTHTFSVRGWQAEKTLRARDWYRSEIFLYVVKGDNVSSSEPLPASFDSATVRSTLGAAHAAEAQSSGPTTP
jgi:hypothetical protein